MQTLLCFVHAEDDEAISFPHVPQDTLDNLLWQVVERLTRPLFEVFGASVGSKVFEDIVNSTLNRQL